VTQVTEATNVTPPDAADAPRADVCVVLAGGIRPSPLTRETHGPTLDLWLGPEGTVLEQWLARAAAASSPGARVQIVHDARMAGPSSPLRSSGMEVSIVAEPRSLRGPAGILKDVCAELDSSSVALVGDAARWLSRAPVDLLAAHAGRGAAVTVGVNADGSPAGLYAVTLGALEGVAKRGFVDIKEQWLERLSKAGAGVWTHRLPGGGAPGHGGGPGPVRPGIVGSRGGVGRVAARRGGGDGGRRRLDRGVGGDARGGNRRRRGRRAFHRVSWRTRRGRRGRERAGAPGAVGG
jgi:hypothetical protein